MSTITKDLGVVTAYGYYKAGGGTMTEAEFTQFMVDFGTASKTAVDAASAALESERAAKQSEETATRKASEAGESASTASTKAGEAAQSASDADTAKTDAITAKTAAETAQGKAEDAQAVAEAVAESIPSDYSQLSEDVSDLKENLSDIDGDVSTLKGLKYLNSNAITLLATILESAVYDDDMSGNIQSLITELNKSPFTQTETLVPIVTGEVNPTTFAYSQGTWQSTFVFEAGEIRGGLLRFAYDSSIAKKFNAVVYILDENDNPLKWTSYFSPENINVQGEWTPKYSNAGEGSGYSQTIDSFSVQIPSGCRAFVWVRAYYETIIDGVTVTDVQGSFRNWAMNGGITVTVEG